MGERHSLATAETRAPCGSGWPGADSELPAVVSGAGCAVISFHVDFVVKKKKKKEQILLTLHADKSIFRVRSINVEIVNAVGVPIGTREPARFARARTAVQCP